jgi:hypothetical protein
MRVDSGNLRDAARNQEAALMILNALALIGGLWVGSAAIRFARWYFFANRDGDSGRSGHHWSVER